MAAPTLPLRRPRYILNIGIAPTATRSSKEIKTEKEISRDISAISTQIVLRFVVNTVVNCSSGLMPVSNTTGKNTKVFPLRSQTLKSLDRVARNSKLAHNMKYTVLEVAALMTLRHPKTAMRTWNNHTNMPMTSVDLRIRTKSKSLPYDGVVTDALLHLLSSTTNTPPQHETQDGALTHPSSYGCLTSLSTKWHTALAIESLFSSSPVFDCALVVKTQDQQRPKTLEKTPTNHHKKT